MLLRRGADSELSSGIPRDAISIISAAPHIATGADGRPMVSPETYIVLNIPRAGGDAFAVANVVEFDVAKLHASGHARWIQALPVYSRRGFQTNLRNSARMTIEKIAPPMSVSGHTGGNP